MPTMYPIIVFVEELQEYLTGNRSVSGNIIRKHSKKLDQLGDISFPLNIKNWCQLINKTATNEEATTIFGYLRPDLGLETQLELLVKASDNWALKIGSYHIRDNSDVHLCLQRPLTIDMCIKRVLAENGNYGLQDKYFERKINIIVDNTLELDATKMTLTDLRVVTTQNVTSNILNSLTCDISNKECDIKITLNSNEKQKNVLVCGSVLNETGVKDVETTASELYKKRSLDMQLMAQHKYGVQLKPSWVNYFEKLGKASVVIEMLQNRTHKATKILLNNLQTTNKGPSFIFYNCARISALLKQFEEKVFSKLYPELPSVDNIDFKVLNQPEEWEMVYVFLLQFPVVVTSCVSDIKLGMINLHCLVYFLSNLSSVFSVYYRRVKILTSAKEHLLPALYARIYLIKAVQQIFHTVLHLLNIEPIKEM